MTGHDGPGTAGQIAGGHGQTGALALVGVDQVNPVGHGQTG